MSQILTKNQVVYTEASAKECKVEEFIGSGGQGEVYSARLDNKLVALKWYFPTTATPPQREALEKLINIGAPNNKFLWPFELASRKGVDGFGYIMPLREKRYKSIVDLMARRIEPTFRALTTAGFELADSFLQLHSKGLCYRDISFGNVFFDPNSGEVLICDNDNVTINNQVQREKGVLGTPRFMAPEIVTGQEFPSTKTDLFSLAVLLFYMFMISHPLDGAKEAAIRSLDLPAMTKIYGLEPIFIYDPENATNRPVKGCHDNALEFWPLYPQFLRDRFTEAFTKGIHDPENGRVREGVWRADMARLRDSIFYCSHCALENFYDPEALKKSGGQPAACWSCKKLPQLPMRLRIKRAAGEIIVVLNHDTALFPYHLDDDPQRRYDFSKSSATVARHPQHQNIWGLKNLSPEKWSVTAADGKMQEVEPGRSVTLANGTKIDFGKTVGEIKV